MTGTTMTLANGRVRAKQGHGHNDSTRYLHDGITVMDRMNRILQVCDRIRLASVCRKWAPLCGMDAPMLEQLVQQRLWDLWKDEWDTTDYPYGGEDDESAWTVPKFAARTAKNVRLEAARTSRRCGVTLAPKDPVDNAMKTLKAARKAVKDQRETVGRIRRSLAQTTDTGEYERLVAKLHEAQTTSPRWNRPCARRRTARTTPKPRDVSASTTSNCPIWTRTRSIPSRTRRHGACSAPALPTRPTNS